jgi:hypothetical protein
MYLQLYYQPHQLNKSSINFRCKEVATIASRCRDTCCSVKSSQKYHLQEQLDLSTQMLKFIPVTVPNNPASVIKDTIVESIVMCFSNIGISNEVTSSIFCGLFQQQLHYLNLL